MIVLNIFLILIRIFEELNKFTATITPNTNSDKCHYYMKYNFS